MFNIANVIQTAGFMVLIKVTYPATHGKVSQWLLAARCSPRPAPQGLMGSTGGPPYPKVGLGLGDRGAWGTFQDWGARSSVLLLAKPAPVPSLRQAAGWAGTPESGSEAPFQGISCRKSLEVVLWGLSCLTEEPGKKSTALSG